MNVKTAWICAQCENIYSNSSVCPVCGEERRLALKDTKLGTIGSGEECVKMLGSRPRRPGEEVFIPGSRFGNRRYPAMTFGLAILPELIREAVQIERRAAGHWTR